MNGTSWPVADLNQLFQDSRGFATVNQFRRQSNPFFDIVCFSPNTEGCTCIYQDSISLMTFGAMKEISSSLSLP